MNALGALHATGLGFGLGVVTGMPLGVINVAIADAAVLGRMHFARGLGIGGGCADAVHAMLAFAGFGTVVTRAPGAVRSLAIIATIVIIGYAALAWRSRRGRGLRPAAATARTAGAGNDRAAATALTAGPASAPVASNDRAAATALTAGADSAPVAGNDRAAATALTAGADSAPVADLPIGRGVATGVLLTLPNPAALAAWVAVAAALWPDADLVEAALLAVSVGIGSALWFTLLARWIGHRRGHPLLAVIPRIALGFLVAIAVVGVIRAL